MNFHSYDLSGLPTTMVLYTADNKAAVSALYNRMLDEQLTPDAMKHSVQTIINADSAAVFTEQCAAYAMHLGKPVKPDDFSMAQLWKHPHVDAMCCRVAVYKHPNGALQIHARADRQPFAVFTLGNASAGHGAAMALCRPAASGALELLDSGDEKVFNGFMPYTKEAAIALFGEAENHARGQCGCGPNLIGKLRI